jgi:hypothetical protein
MIDLPFCVPISSMFEMQLKQMEEKMEALVAKHERDMETAKARAHALTTRCVGIRPLASLCMY